MISMIVFSLLEKTSNMILILIEIVVILTVSLYKISITFMYKPQNTDSNTSRGEIIHNIE